MFLLSSPLHNRLYHRIAIVLRCFYHVMICICVAKFRPVSQVKTVLFVDCGNNKTMPVRGDDIQESMC